MTALRAARALSIALVLAATAAADPAAAAKIRREADFVRRVNEAIDRGVAWLRKSQAKDGSFPNYPLWPGGVTALAYQTLRVCGVPADDPAAARAWASLRRDYRKKDLQVYTAALDLMAVAEHGERVDADGGDHDVRLSPEDLAWATELTRCLVGGQDRHGAWSYEVEGGARIFGPTRGYYDHSNSQYALLGLKAAARCGVPVAPAVWKLSLAHFLASQEKAGPPVPRGGADASAAPEKGRTTAVPVDSARGWAYQSCIAPLTGGYGDATPPMTAAGVSSIVICRSELLPSREMDAKLDAESERAAWDGLAWIGRRRFDGRFKGSVDLYGAYGVERAGILAGVEWMGDFDWYGAGAKVILDAQRPDGGWSGVMDVEGLPDPVDVREIAQHVVDTCFALLFLKKGTIPVRQGALTPLGGDVDINFAEAAKLTGADLGDFLDLILTRLPRAADDGVRTRLLDGATAAGPKIVEPLLVRLDGDKADRRAAAHEVLRRATAQDFGWRAEASADERGAAVAKWQEWWLSVSGRLVYDPVKKLLVVP